MPAKFMLRNILKNKRLRSVLIVMVMGAALEALNKVASATDIQRGADLIEASIRLAQVVMIWYTGLKTPDSKTECLLEDANGSR